MLRRVCRADCVAALVLAGIGLFVVVQSWTSASGVFVKAGGVTAWTLPGIYGAILVVLSLLLLAKSLLGPAVRSDFNLDRRAWVRVVGTVAVAVLYAFALSAVPFFVATAAVLAALFVLYGRRNLPAVAATALVGAGVLDVLFIRLLKLPL